MGISFPPSLLLLFRLLRSDLREAAIISMTKTTTTAIKVRPTMTLLLLLLFNFSRLGLILFLAQEESLSTPMRRHCSFFGNVFFTAVKSVDSTTTLLIFSWNCTFLRIGFKHLSM
jgi:hypothetical protein